MNNWIQNIKGQLTELATEVLHEATEEGQVSTSSELQVEKKRSTESERLFLAEKARREALEKKLQELEEQLYSSNIENDAIKEKFMPMVSDRDQRITQLNIEIERLKISRDEKGFKSIDLDESLVPAQKDEEIDSEIRKLKEKHEREISMIMSVNAANLEQMKEEYEQKIREFEENNKSLANSLAQFETLRNELNKSNAELGSFREKFTKMQSEYIAEIETLKLERDEFDLANYKEEMSQQIDALRAELKEREEGLQRMRNEKLVVSTIPEEFKRPSSDTDESAVSNNEWERMGKDEIEVEGVSSSTSETKECYAQHQETLISEEKNKCRFTQTEKDEQCELWEQKMAEMGSKIVELENKIKELEGNEEYLLKLKVENEEMKGIIERKEEKCQEYCIKLKEYSINSEKARQKIENVEKLKAENEEMKAIIERKEEECQKYCIKLQKMAEMGSKIKELEENEEFLSKLKAENVEIKRIIEKKEEEYQEYCTKLQGYTINSEEMKQRIENVEGKLLVREQEIAMRNERITKLEGELQRLRGHLMTVEEISSKEAIAAEERETELRNQIRKLQEKLNSDELNMANTMERYKDELMEVKERIGILQNENIQMEALLKEKEAALNEADRGLKNLQIVLKELADDQQKERQQSEKERSSLRAELMNDQTILSELREQISQMKEERGEERRQLESIKSNFEAKNALIDELENQLEDIRTKGRERDKPLMESSSSSLTTYKIDDSTLRQLFLSFFTAEKSKQPEIIIVMSKILGYSSEEQEQIQKALKNSTGSSWLFNFGSGNQEMKTGQQQLSLTEQFVRFLEQESITNAQPMMTLTLGTDQTRNDFLVGESIPSPAPNQGGQSATDLRTIFDS